MRTLRSFFATNIKKLMEYKLDFAFNVFSVIVWVAAGLMNIHIIFKKFNMVAGWTLSEVGLLYGMWSLTFAIYNAFGSGILELDNLILTGKLDGILLKPVNPLLQIIMSRLNTMGIGFLVFGSILVLYSLGDIEINWSVAKAIYLIVAAISGGILIFSMNLILASTSFWTLRSNSAIQIGYDLHKFVQYPMDIYGKGIKILLSTIIPFGYSNYYSIAFLLGKCSMFWGIISIIVAFLSFGIAIIVWKMGIHSYESVGS